MNGRVAVVPFVVRVSGKPSKRAVHESRRVGLGTTLEYTERKFKTWA